MMRAVHTASQQQRRRELAAVGRLQRVLIRGDSKIA
jgi:hypothetical protein